MVAGLSFYQERFEKIVMTMKRVFVTGFLLILTISFARAGEGTDTVEFKKHLFYQELNRLGNIRSAGTNPVGLSYNQIGRVTDASVGVGFGRGSFHAIDHADKRNDFSVKIDGLQRFGKLSLSGSFTYLNAKDYARRWNSTLYLTSTNPFLFCDSVPSDVSTEQFSLSAAAAYVLTKRVAAGLEVSYLTGSAADQTDPRPKTNAMRLYLKPGVEWKISQSHALGLAVQFGLFRSDMTNTIINTQESHTYFLMKGMGDYFVRTTNDLSSYPRDYKGSSWQAAMQWVVQPTGGMVANSLEISYSALKEDAVDGGSAYTFRGGDYRKKQLDLRERLDFGNEEKVRQHVVLQATYAMDEGFWYDQRRMVDTEHANLVYYEILAKSKVRESNYLDAGLDYQVDFLKDGMPDAMLKAGAVLQHARIKQYEMELFEQKYTLVHVVLEGNKRWWVGSCCFQASLAGAYRFGIGGTAFAAVREDISAVYTAPAFAWQTADVAKVRGRVEFDVPLSFYGYRTGMGIFADVTGLWGEGGTTRTFTNIGLNVRL